MTKLALKDGRSLRREQHRAQSPNKPRPLAPDDYNRVVAKAELGQIVLLRCNYDVTSVIEKKDVQALKKSIESKYNSIAFDAKQGIIAGEVEWQVAIAGKASPKFKVTAIFGISYEELVGLNETAAGAFFLRVARFATYPYFRALVSHLSWSSGLRIPPLPIIRELKVPKAEPDRPATQSASKNS